MSHRKFPLAIYFIHGKVFVSMLVSQFVPPSPPHVNRRLIGKVPDAGKDRGQEEKRVSNDEMAGSPMQWT